MGAVNTTYTFTATDTITSTKMNNIIDQTTMTSDAVFTGGTIEVVSGKLRVASGKITSNELGANSVVTAAIADSSVTTAKIANSSVTTAKIANSAITTTKIADSTSTTTGITTGKIANESITAAKLNGAQTGTAPIFGVRAWVNFDASRDASGATNASNTNRFIRSSGNVTSVLKTGTGKFTVTFTAAMPNTNYIVTSSAGIAGSPRFACADRTTATTTSIEIETDDKTGDAANFTENNVMVVA